MNNSPKKACYAWTMSDSKVFGPGGRLYYIFQSSRGKYTFNCGDKGVGLVEGNAKLADCVAQQFYAIIKGWA